MSLLTPPPSDRDTRGRFAPGNPGKARGQRNRLTKAVERLFENAAEEIGEKAIEAARKGDVTAIRLVLERVAPVRRGRLIDLPDMPAITTIHDVAPALAFLARAVSRGRVTPEEAAAVADVIDRFTKALGAAEFEQRLAEIERRQSAVTNPQQPFTFHLDRPMTDEAAAENAALARAYERTLSNDGAELEPTGEG